MDDRRLLKRIMVETVEIPGRCVQRGKENAWTDCVADDLGLFGIVDGEGGRTRQVVENDDERRS